MERILLVVVVSVFLMMGCVATDKTMTGNNEAMTEGHGHSDAKVTRHFDESLTKLTDNNLYSLELVVPGKNLMMGVNTIEIIVHHATGGDVAQADLTVTPWMPSMGHGVMQKPVITERGGGLYSIDNVVLSMTGHWQMQVKVAKDSKEDTAVFDFPEVKAMGHEHAMMNAPPPEDLDTSTMKVTASNAFTVMYKSTSGHIRINRIHSWELTIKDADGQPVNDAMVTVVGDMPEHGHGLPTQPEITKIGTGGLYRVDGMKFTMPGWWVVTVSIMVNGVHDSVSFNLNII
ncbi:MAG: FixH family protein [Desulfobulbaceae bacterium]|nr:FixH family protein [Desulfobulbaceae bacterium]